MIPGKGRIPAGAVSAAITAACVSFAPPAAAQICGDFDPAASFPAGDAPEYVASADFSGDGKADLAVSNLYSAQIRVWFGNGDGTFQEGGVYPTGLKPIWVATGDVNLDGFIDLVTANIDGGTLTILLNNGDGTFGQRTDLPAGDRPAAVAIADFNRDSLADIAVGLYGGSGVALFYAMGPGSFAESAPISFPSAVGALVVADLNRDGRPELVAGGYSGYSYDSWALYWYPDGTFAGAFPVVDRHAPGGRTIVAADFDGDGWPDLAGESLEYGKEDEIAIVFNNHDGTFSAGFEGLLVPTGGVGLRALATSDFDSDGMMDLAATDRISGDVSVILGRRNRFLEVGHVQAVGTTPRGVVAADFDGDGRPDVAAANADSDDVSVILSRIGTGSGFEASATVIPDGLFVTGLACADFDGDGALDFATVNGWTQDVITFRGAGDGTFTESGRCPSPGVYVGGGPVTADLNRDGLSDLVVVGEADGVVVVFLARSDGTFAETDREPAGTGPVSVAAGDYTGDGLPDLAVAASGQVLLLANAGDGHFTPSGTLTSGSRPTWIIAPDVDSDGLLDLAVANGSAGSVTVRFGLGSGSFSKPAAWDAGTMPTCVAAADLNADGVLDLVTSNAGSGDISLLFGTKDRRFEPQVRVRVMSAPARVAVADLDSDGSPDIGVVGDGEMGMAVVSMGGEAWTARFGFVWNGGEPKSGLAAADLNGDGRTDVIGISWAGPSTYSVFLQGHECARSCHPDCTRDRKLTINDFICFQSEWRRRTAYGDYDGSGTYTVNDFIRFQADFAAGCP